jgi:hypothetical protein
MEGTSEQRQSELMISETEARYSHGTNQMGSVFVMKTLYTLQYEDCKGKGHPTTCLFHHREVAEI